MTAAQVVTALFVDLGEGRENKQTGRIQWSRQPAARFECLLCHTQLGPVTGATKVAAFTATVHTDHRATCPATTQGAHTA